jgi:hypothetical protein
MKAVDLKQSLLQRFLKGLRPPAFGRTAGVLDFLKCVIWSFTGAWSFLKPFFVQPTLVFAV